MEWATLLSSDRFRQEPSTASPSDARSSFEGDVDRIIFSGSFRRLARKTQVHPFAPNDHIHTRLTHSLEVAEVGKALGKAVGKKIEKDLPGGVSCHDIGSIVQAACLAHDIGNPPFGHAGEHAIAHWCKSTGEKFLEGLLKPEKEDIASFDGNAQGFRILTQTQNHLFEGGLRLTYATLGAFLKYPWSSCSRIISDNGKFGAFLTEEKILNDIADKTGLVFGAKKNRWCKHPLAFLTEAADDICYAIIDLEDGVELGILSFDKVSDLLLRSLKPPIRKAVRKGFASPKEFRINFARLRGPVFDVLVTTTVKRFMDNYQCIMDGTFDSSLFKQLDSSDTRVSVIDDAKKLAETTLYVDQKKVEIELGCFSTTDCLLSAFCEAAIECADHLKNPEKVTRKSQLILKLLENHAPSDKNQPPGDRWSKYNCLRRVLDYISGMTDNYATYIAQQIQGRGFTGTQRP